MSLSLPCCISVLPGEWSLGNMPWCGRRRLACLDTTESVAWWPLLQVSLSFFTCQCLVWNDLSHFLCFYFCLTMSLSWDCTLCDLAFASLDFRCVERCLSRYFVAKFQQQYVSHLWFFWSHLLFLTYYSSCSHGDVVVAGTDPYSRWRCTVHLTTWMQAQFKRFVPK